MSRQVVITGSPTAEEIARQAVIDDPQAPPRVAITSAPVQRPDAASSSGFFDPEHPERTPHVLLEQHVTGEVETFRLCRPIGFWDVDLGLGIIVPDNLATNESDLTSAPRLFTWLIGRSGPHLAAALVHDGLVTRPLSYVAGRFIPRGQADIVFRHALHGLGVNRLRRWLMYAAVTAGTMLAKYDPDGSDDPRKQRPDLRARIGLAVMVLSIVLLGTAATVDVLDGRSLLPWMGDRSTVHELAAGIGGALLYPVLICWMWGRGRWVAAILAGWALALLLHVTVALALVSSVYLAAESLFPPRNLRAFLISLGTLSGLLTFIAVVVWLGFPDGWPHPR